MKRFIFFVLVVFCVNILFAFGQENRVSPDKLWQEVDDSVLSQRTLNRAITPKSYRSFFLDKKALQNLLDKAPMQFTDASVNNDLVMTLPMPDGKFSRFLIEEISMFEPALAAKHPEIKTYRGKGIDDPTATASFDVTPQGFHSMILSTNGTILVDPYAVGDTNNYISYEKNDANGKNNFVCNFKDETFVDSAFSYSKFTPEINISSGATLRTYRLALAATAEYTNVFRQTGDTDAQARANALAAMTTTMNRVNGVYEKEVAIRMILVANEDSIIYTDTNTDGYTNDNGSTMLGENQTNLDGKIGSANYDIGHVFSTGGGGVAQLGVPCGSSKAKGVTGLSNPVGDYFAIDYVAHEMGHQWGANHTFNGAVSNCAGGNRAASSAYEPGGGVTIMAYAGICGNQNLATRSLDTFHVKSLESIVAYSQNGGGNSCAVPTSTGNIPPTVSAPASFNIPKGTPFSLTASATDANGDSVTYDWQEYDLGASTTTVPNSDSDGARPIFRSYLPTSGGTRTFPSMQYILNNANVPPSVTGSLLTGEILPSITRTMNFQVIARDNRADGGFSTAATTVNVDGNSGPFNVTAPNSAISWNANSSQTISWNAANTTNAPVSAANVKISLSTDGGQTFPVILAASTPNDGAETITVPGVSTTQARIKIEAVNNIFFDISDANFTITSAPSAFAAITGQVRNAQGRGISRARVTMSDGSSNRIAITNPFGYYHFENVASNVSYTFTVGSKSYRFNNPSVLFVGANVSAYNFTALP